MVDQRGQIEASNLKFPPVGANDDVDGRRRTPAGDSIAHRIQHLRREGKPAHRAKMPLSGELLVRGLLENGEALFDRVDDRDRPLTLDGGGDRSRCRGCDGSGRS